MSVSLVTGKLKWVENIDPRLGKYENYWFLKVQAGYSNAVIDDLESLFGDMGA